MELGKRYKLLDLIGRRTGVYHSAVFTCFSFDPVFFSSYYMPKLRSVGIRNVIVLVDAGQYDRLAEDYEQFGKCLKYGNGNGYTLVRQECSTKGYFHPKISFFCGESASLAFVGSGNLTFGGMAYNDEVWGAFSTSDDSSCMPIIASVWAYLAGLLKESNLKVVETQYRWIMEYCPWLASAEDLAGEAFIDEEGQTFHFATNEPGNTLLEQISTVVDGSKVKKISLVAPFYDETGIAIKALRDKFHPQAVDCYVDDMLGIAPCKIDSELSRVCTFFKISSDIQKVHAKVIQIECVDKTILAIGSANATSAALCNGDANDEAEIIISHPRNIDYVETLGLSKDALQIRSMSAPGRTAGASIKPSRRLQVTIKSCELEDDAYHFILSKPVKGVQLSFFDAKGEQYYFPIDDFEAEFEKEAESMPNAESVIIYDGDTPISNRFLVINYHDVIRSCPDKDLCNQEMWMSAALETGVWHYYLDKILGSVTFDDPMPTHASKSGYASKTNQDADTQEITLEEFQKTHYTGIGSKNELLCKNIKDYLSEALRIREDDEEGDDSEEISQDDIDRGVPETRSSKKEAKIDTTSTAEKLLKKLNLYQTRLYSYYGKICKPLDDDETDEFLGHLTKMNMFRAPKSVDYIRIMNAVLALSLMSTEEVIKSSETSQWEIRSQLIKLVGRFLIIYRLEPEESESLIDLRQEFFIDTVILFSHLNWSGITGEAKVLLLNLLELFHKDTGAISKAVDGIQEAISMSKLSVREDSFAMVFDAVATYKSFIKKDFRTYVKPVDTDWRNAIAYKQSIGFMLCNNFERNPSSLIPYTIDAFSPGFYEAYTFFASQGSKLCVVEHE